MHAYPFADYMRHFDAGNWDAVADLLLSSAVKLQRGGAELLVCPANTVHQAVDLVRDRSPLPWLHIAEEVAAVAAERRFKRLLVLGTRYLMESPVYPAKLTQRGIQHDR
jgi:aspartate racemase